MLVQLKIKVTSAYASLLSLRMRDYYVAYKYNINGPATFTLLKSKLRKENTYSNRVPSMLITSSKTSSHEASTTPTAFIALLQLLGYIKKIIKIGCDNNLMQANTHAQNSNNIQGNQLQEALQKCEVLTIFRHKRHNIVINAGTLTKFIT